MELMRPHCLNFKPSHTVGGGVGSLLVVGSLVVGSLVVGSLVVGLMVGSVGAAVVG